jgi:hypothetical protein
VNWLKGGRSIYDLQGRLGHASIKTTEIYCTFLTEEEDRIVKDSRMKLVVHNSQRDIERERHTGHIQAAYDRVAANLLRVLRGAGDIGGVLHYAADYVAACERAREAGQYPVSIQYSIPTAWDIIHSTGTEDDQKRWMQDGTYEKEVAVQTIISGALQQVASELLDQKSLIARGKQEMTEGIRAYEAWRESNRKKEVSKTSGGLTKPEVTR